MSFADERDLEELEGNVLLKLKKNKGSKNRVGKLKIEIENKIVEMSEKIRENV